MCILFLEFYLVYQYFNLVSSVFNLFLWVRHLVSWVCCILSWEVLCSRFWKCHLVSLWPVCLQTGSPAGVSTTTCWSSPTTTSSAKRTAWSWGGCTTTPAWPPLPRDSRTPSCGTIETAPRATTSSVRNYRKAQVCCRLHLFILQYAFMKFLPFLPFRAEAICYNNKSGLTPS